MAGTGNGASCANGTCLCDDDPTPSCTVPPAEFEPSLATLDQNSKVSLISGVRVLLTGVGARTASLDPGAVSPTLRRPAAYDRIAMTVTNRDNYWRTQEEFSVLFDNFVVTP